VLESYSGKELFSKHLKRFFHRNRQLGSRDRRVIQHFSYNYFRTGKMFSEHSVGERLALSNSLLFENERPASTDSPLLEYLKEKYQVANINEQNKNLKLEKLFPFTSLLSDKIEKEPFIRSFLTQPKLWIRVRKNFLAQTIGELNEKSISFDADTLNLHTLFIKNATSLDSLEAFKKGYFEIQDWASQQTIKYIQPKPKEYWWDACCGSGGKSLMMLDEEPSLNIYATDVRESVLENLKERFCKSGIKNYISEKVDVTNLPENFILPHFNHKSIVDGIIADVPCTGSGTWARTPEWIEMFEDSDRAATLEKFTKLQFEIVSNLVKYLPVGKMLIYITCSVFSVENEDIIAIFADKLPLKLLSAEYIKDYEIGADTMFVARMLKV